MLECRSHPPSRILTGNPSLPAEAGLNPAIRSRELRGDRVNNQGQEARQLAGFPGDISADLSRFVKKMGEIGYVCLVHLLQHP